MKLGENDGSVVSSCCCSQGKILRYLLFVSALCSLIQVLMYVSLDLPVQLEMTSNLNF